MIKFVLAFFLAFLSVMLFHPEHDLAYADDVGQFAFTDQSSLDDDSDSFDIDCLCLSFDKPSVHSEKLKAVSRPVVEQDLFHLAVPIRAPPVIA